MTNIDLTTIPTRILETAIWNLSASGSGTVTYHQFRLPGASEAVWPEALPGAICTRRERGGTFRAAERHASSEYRHDALPIGTIKITITVNYRRGSKTGSTRTETRLVEYRESTETPGKIISVWE